jgi:cystathionine gamma-synthase
MPDSLHPETLAVHAGRQVDPATGAVTPNLTLSTTFERAPDGTLPHGLIYSRYNNPNRGAVEQALTALEGGKEALAFASGQAASTAVLQSLEPGSRVIFPDDLYLGTRTVAQGFYTRWGLQVEFADFGDTAGLQARLRSPARLVWIETPSNPQMKVADIATLAAAARAAGALVVVDNTFASPVVQNPLRHGAHLVMHSTTKYLGGHSDIVGGALVAGADCPAETLTRLRDWQRLGGGVPSPFDCWLLLRSLATLPVRVRAQCAAAADLAQWLAGHPKVEKVHYPGLPSHPNHAVAMRQMNCGGAMLSFEVRGGFDAARDVTGRVRLITRATSLGSVESLIEHRKLVEPPDSPTPPSLIRLSVGLEHVADLRADLAQALG